MEPKVNIILATYNGEKYIAKQLNSLLEQTYKNFDIYIRDDGSTDNTVAIIQEYINKNPEKIFFLENKGKNLRCPESFYEIIRKCGLAEYYALCDQDDIWYPQKIQWAVERLGKEDNRVPLLYYSACDYSTQEGKIIRKSPKQKENMELHNVLYYTPGSGFTMVMNEMARHDFVLCTKPGNELHDRWLARCAVCFGKLIYDNRSTAAHIRHEDAVTSGDAGYKNLLVNFIKEELCGDDARREKQAIGYFYKLNKEKLTVDEQRILQLFSQKNNCVTWIKKLFYPYRLRTRISGELALRFLFFIGKI